MKRIISLFAVVLLLLSCFSFTALGIEEYEEINLDGEVYADLDPDSVITLSDDYQTLYCGEERYTRFSDSLINVDIIAQVRNSVELSDNQISEVKKVYVEANEKGNIIWAYIDFNDGARLEVAFLHEDYVEEYNDIMMNDAEDYIIDFQWPEGNTLEVKREKLFGEKTTLFLNYYSISEYFYVTAQPEDGSFYISKGELLVYEDEYYYIDYEESQIEPDDGFYIEEKTNVMLYKITDTDLVKQLDEGVQEYYNDGLGFLENDELALAVSDFLLIAVFGVLPLAALIVFLILALRSKTVYKKFFTGICALSAAELVIFGVVVFFIFVIT